MKLYHSLFIFILLFVSNVFSQKDTRPGLFFREDWKEIPAEIPLNQKHVSNKNLNLSLYGPKIDSIKKSHHDKPLDDPYYVWSGLSSSNWMVTLKHTAKNVDLTGLAKIKTRTKQSGLRALRITLKQANGIWLVSDFAIKASKDWMITELNIQDITWHVLDPKMVVETGVAKKVNLSSIEAIGFTDLMPGGKSDACSRLDWIEVYGNAVLRK